MTLDEAIEHLEDSIKNKEFSCESCKEEHKQLLEWLKELRNLKEKKNHYLQSIEYRNRIISMYRDGLEDIEAYLYEHASEHDGYRIRLDVSEIIRDVEKAVDKAGEL